VYARSSAVAEDDVLLRSCEPSRLAGIRCCGVDSLAIDPAPCVGRDSALFGLTALFASLDAFDPVLP
jgi:hypothetical protein